MKILSPLALLLVLVCTFILSSSINVSAIDCTPSGTLVNEQYQGCNNIHKDATWSIHWPDGTSETFSFGGTGGCGLSYQCCDEQHIAPTECWPAFGSPTASQSGRWSVVVVNKNAQVFSQSCPGGCSSRVGVNCVTSTTSTYWIEHTCACTQEMVENCDAQLGQLDENCNCNHNVGIHTPIIIDVEGNGFALTNAANGVNFDLDANGTPERLAWTNTSSDESFLVLDRNGNGFIDNGAELFGDITPQPASPNPNGFIALAVYDKPANGGNNNGLIQKTDAIFSSLRLWRDANHNGVSEAGELSSLQQVGLQALDLDYKTSRRVDQFGNQFRYRAKVKDKKNAQLGRWAWDVFLLAQP